MDNKWISEVNLADSLNFAKKSIKILILWQLCLVSDSNQNKWNLFVTNVIKDR